MKSNHLSLIILLLWFNIPSFAQNHSFEWLKTMGGDKYDKATAITIDSYGDVITVGWFCGTADYDPGVSTEYLFAGLEYGNAADWHNSDIFIQKLDPNGNLLWAVRVGNDFDSTSLINVASAVVTDNNDNIYISGSFMGTFDFDPGNSTSFHTAIENSDAFILKLDSNGDFVWVKTMGGTGLGFINSMKFDLNYDLILTGQFNGEIDFDPGTNISNTTSLGINDAFISKLDINGDLVWVKFLGSDGVTLGEAVTTDNYGNVYTIGGFSKEFDADPGQGVSMVSHTDVGLEIFIHKLNSNGDFVWVKPMYDFNGSTWSNGISIDVDANGNIYSTGCYTDSLDLDPGVGTFHLPFHGVADLYVQKLDSNGQFIWAKGFGGIGYDQGRCIKTDSYGNVYVTGRFTDTIDFDPGIGVENLTCNGYEDAFILMLDTDGNYKWAHSFGGDYGDMGLALTIDDNLNVYSTGEFQLTAHTDSIIGLQNITSEGTYDVYTFKFASCMTSSIDSIVACDPYTWIDGNTYSVSNQLATYTLTNVNGCDSFVTLDLTFGGNVDVSTVQNGHTVTANNSTATYAWLDCDNNYSLIPGETNQSFTAGAFGNYAVEISENGCIDTSTCQVLVPLGVIEQSFKDELVVVPNPNSGTFSIEFTNPQDHILLQIYSLLGKEVLNEIHCNTSLIPINLKEFSGVYMIKLSDNKGNETVVKVVKE